jgi:NRPS condensation-like uncharacterized protein
MCIQYITSIQKITFNGYLKFKLKYTSNYKYTLNQLELQVAVDI